MLPRNKCNISELAVDQFVDQFVLPKQCSLLRVRAAAPCQRRSSKAAMISLCRRVTFLRSGHTPTLTPLLPFGRTGPETMLQQIPNNSNKVWAQHQQSLAGVMPETTGEMAAAAESVGSTALSKVWQRVQSVAVSASRPVSQVRLVAVSKTKPVSLIKEVYDGGQRHFGENYVQEITEKAPELPEDIQWHFIGHLQSKKAKALVTGVPNLYMVESVDSEKVANNLDKAVAGAGRSPLKVLVQVNTSGEESKFGLEPDKCLVLARHVKLECPNLIFSGLMTIGMADYTSTPLNFKTMMSCRETVCKELDISPDECELSMGMSGDFELGIQMGSTNVRVGSAIFGPRVYPPKK